MDETRQLLKVFGVAVMDFEAEAEKLKSAAEQLTGDTDKAEIAGHLKNVTELCRELNARWFEVTQRVSSRKTNCWVGAPKPLIRSLDGSTEQRTERSKGRLARR